MACSLFEIDMTKAMTYFELYSNALATLMHFYQLIEKHLHSLIMVHACLAIKVFKLGDTFSVTCKNLEWVWVEE